MIADSTAVIFSTYENLIYAIGKGPSDTTVAAPDVAVPLGSSVVIRGTVTDVSPGTKQNSLPMRIPNGVPAVSDDSVGEWMKYVYTQFPLPTNVSGVEVTLNVLDSNGNYREIGKTTSDASGSFSYQWTPDITGKYTVIATFAGSEAYYGSSAETAIGVSEAPAASAPPIEQPSSMTDTYVMYAAVAIIVAVAIVGALILLMLRKRP